jgi:hypothetical protein
MKLLLVVALVLGGCSATWGGQHRTSIRIANATTAGIAAAGMALDWCGTRHAALTRTDAWEGGMPTSEVIGSSPTAGRVDAYFAISTVALAAAAQVMPERYRWIAYGAVAAVEAVTVGGNIATTKCGPLGR